MIFQAIYALQNEYLPLENVVKAEKYAEHIFKNAEIGDLKEMDIIAFTKVVDVSTVAISLVDAIINAANQPYRKQKTKTGSMGRRRGSSILEIPKKNSENVRPHRLLTIWGCNIVKL